MYRLSTPYQDTAKKSSPWHYLNMSPEWCMYDWVNLAYAWIILFCMGWKIIHEYGHIYIKFFTQNNGSSPCEKKTNKQKKKNEQSKHNMPLQVLWSWGIKYQSKPNICGNNRSLIRSWPFLIQITALVLQSPIIITQDVITQGSASDCRSMGHEFESIPVT